MTEHEIARVPSTANERRLVWAVRCVICHEWIRLVPALITPAEFLKSLGDQPAVHRECRDKPSATTPALPGMDEL